MNSNALTVHNLCPSISDFRFEYGASALGLGTPSPRLSWKTAAATDNWTQESYEIAAEFPSTEIKKTTGRIHSGDSVFVPWPFTPLRSREQAQINVRVWGTDGTESPWSETFGVEIGLLSASDWKARFIAAPWDNSAEKPGPCPLLRREFTLRAPVAKARLYVTALGLYEVFLNDEPVGNEAFSPGWTSYKKRLKYRTFDVTRQLLYGPNAIGAQLADGWYRGRMGYNGGRRGIYGNRTALLAQLEIFYADGTLECITTDALWNTRAGPILSSGIYDGESYDARKACARWTLAGMDTKGWEGVEEIDHDKSILTSSESPPVRRTAVVKPVSISESPSGKVLVDFGQNLVGRIRFALEGPGGLEVTLRHAEVLEDGELGIRPLRTARQTDRYILKGGSVETWEPRFTFHGFRYVEIQGWPGKPRMEDLCAVVYHSDLERTGWFSCSEPLLNTLHENIVWSVRGNFLDIPTDCPQRDERLGWTGDIQIFAPAACFLFDCGGFLRSWLADLALEQRGDGAVPLFVPNINAGPIVPSGAWGDASVIVPWVLYQSYRDTGVLQAQFASLCAWVDYLETTVGDSRLWTNGFQFGDWLDPNSPPERPGDSRTDSSLIATAYFARSAELASKIAAVLEEGEAEKRYTKLTESVRKAFAEEFISPNGRVVSDTATAYSLVIQFGLAADPGLRLRAGKRLAELVRDAGYRISTGFIGTPLICDALCETGQSRTALLLLMQKECPSWLYPVTMGATTMWERWDSMLPDGKINPGDTTSFNHYALGSIADWLHRTIGGISPIESGYKRFLVKPLIGGGLTHASASVMTPYGRAECRWKLEGGNIDLQVTVPANASARVEFVRSGKEPAEIGSGTYSWTYIADRETPHQLTLNSTLGELFADPKAMEWIVGEIPHMACLKTITLISSATTIGQQMDFLPDGESYKKTLEDSLRRYGNAGKNPAARTADRTISEVR